MEVIRDDLLGTVEQFERVLCVPPEITALGGWLFLGEHRTRKQVLYGGPAFRDLMLWWGVLADTALDGDVWDGRRTVSWASVIEAVRKSSGAVLGRWLVATRPFVTVLCEAPPSYTMDDIHRQWIAHERAWRKMLQERPPKGIELVRRREVSTRMFRILNRKLDDTFRTQPDDVPRWHAALEQDTSEKAAEVRRQVKEDFASAQKTGNPSSYLGRWVWYDGRLYRDRQVVYTVASDDPALHRPQSFEHVLARCFRYLGVFLALGIATTTNGKPLPPLPDSFSLPITCTLCQVHVRTEIQNRELLRCSDEELQEKIAARKDGTGGIAFWCPSCFQNRIEPVAYVRLIEEKEHTKS